MTQISPHLATLLLTCTLVAGCNEVAKNPPDVGGPNSLHTWSDDGQSSAGTVFRVGTLFVIWTDSPNGGGGSESASMHSVTFQGRLITSDRGQVNFSGESADGRSGTAVIDGRSFDLSKGNLFLVATAADGYRVKQLKRELANLKADSEALRDFAKADIEIQEFFGGNRAERQAR